MRERCGVDVMGACVLGLSVLLFTAALFWLTRPTEGPRFCKGQIARAVMGGGLVVVKSVEWTGSTWAYYCKVENRGGGGTDVMSASSVRLEGPFAVVWLDECELERR